MASIIENIRQVMGNTPTFRPSNISTFGDPSLEAGDIVTVTTPEGSETVPLFSLDMDWHGAAETTLSASGNNKRDVQKAGKRADYALESAISSAFGGGGGALQQMEDALEEEMDGIRTDVQMLIANVDDTAAGFVARATVDDLNQYKEAAAEMFVGVKDVDAYIGLYLVQKPDGKKETLAEILADEITLRTSKVDATSSAVTGLISINSNGVKIQGSTVTIDGNLIAKVADIESLVATAFRAEKADISWLATKTIGCSNLVASGAVSSGNGACYLGKDGYASFTGGVSTASLSVGNPGVVFKNCNLKIGETTATNTFLGSGDITFL